jgi:nitrite reductase/ring-hydroxylating ferredoxin subunit
VSATHPAAVAGRDLVDVGSVDEFDEAVPRVVRVAGREVVVVLWRGEFFALRNVCPHQSGSFLRGLVCHDITASPAGSLEVGEPVIVCPRHCWPYELRTGQCTVDPRKRVRVYDVRIDQSRVLVSAGRKTRDSDGP